jgi:multidrug efflux pump subunit AcrB
METGIVAKNGILLLDADQKFRGAGSQMLQPLAIAAIGGLLARTQVPGRIWY